jgi:tRNA (guanine37-N1)-methyltransferase
MAGLRIDLFTIFPDAVDAYCAVGIVGRARRAGVIDLRICDLRQGADDPRRSVDDAPFGGGPGMVLAAPPVFAAVERAEPPRPLLLMSPAGRRFDQAHAAELSQAPFSLLCGRYEGADQRIADHLVDGELSIGDYVLAGGELAAMVVVEAVARLVPGVVGNEASVTDESFSSGLLEYPQYTRPASFRGWDVPEILLSGDHGRVAQWRQAASLHRTLERRPDLIARRGGLDEAEVRLLSSHGYPVPPAAAASVPAPPAGPASHRHAGPPQPEEHRSP